MKITTKKGDDGYTDCNHNRVFKDDFCIECIGQIDECMALCIVIANEDETLLLTMKEVVDTLSMICASLSGYGNIWELNQLRKLKYLEDEINMHQLPSTFEFQYPYHDKIGGFCNLARTVIRRAERAIWSLYKIKPQDKVIPIYLNRLSDFFYLLSLKNNSSIS